ncbi:MAG: hypothetical protein Q9214_008041, partial [Letrouitia sp. 1 TL-2023]
IKALLYTRSGGVTVNSIMLHAAVPNAPFGGVGLSGQGSYHGPWGLRALSHMRTVVEWPAWMEYLMNWTYHPFDEKNIAKVAVKKRGSFKRGEGIEDQRIGRSRWLMPGFIALLGAGIAIIAVAKERLVKT